MRDLRIRDFRCASEFVGKGAEPRAKNKRNLRPEFSPGKNKVGSKPGAFVFAQSRRDLRNRSSCCWRGFPLLGFLQSFPRAHVNIPTMEADIRLAMVPASIARMPNLASWP